MTPPSIDDILAMPEEHVENSTFTRTLEVPFIFGGLHLTLIYEFLEDEDYLKYQMEILVKEFPYNVGFVQYRDHPKNATAETKERWIRYVRQFLDNMFGRLPDDPDFCWYERQQMGERERKAGYGKSI